MSAFTESVLRRKLTELNSSQQSIQTLSLWLIHHRKHHASIVKTWFRELQEANEDRKLTFMYLANDVIQNSKKKGPEYGTEFALVLSKVFTHIGHDCKSEKLLHSISRILRIWEDRGVYDAKIITDYRRRLNKDKEKEKDKDKDNGGESSKVGKSPDEQPKEKSERSEKRKRDDDGKTKSKHNRTAVESEETPESAPGENGDLSPYVPAGEPPEPEELIKAMINVENSASGDAVMRERIANLPSYISEVSCLGKLQDKEAAKTLSKEINEAVQLLNDYNNRLANEMEERIKLHGMLRDYIAEQRDLLVQAEKRHEEYKKKLNVAMAVQKEIQDHLSNLPDLTTLPDVTVGLAPLPSAGDLFNIH